MNIFVLDEDPITSAEMQCNRHVVKMILESAQLLSNAYWYYAQTLEERNYLGIKLLFREIYKPTHMNHPCSTWARSSLQNWCWLWLHASSLAREYTYRYGKIHKTEHVIIKLFENTLFDKLPNSAHPEEHPQCMPEVYRNTNVVTAYRKYYIGDKHSFAKWSKRKPPYWWPYKGDTQ